MISPRAEVVEAALCDRHRELVLGAVADTLVMEGLRYSAREVRRGGHAALVDAMELLRALVGRRGTSVEARPAADALEMLIAGDVAGAIRVLAARDGKSVAAWVVDAVKGS